MITAILPAHNEAESLPATIASLRAQTVQPDRILVVSDNSTDDTVEVARSLGVEVMETVGNTGRKAGALNQALTGIDTDLVLVMDADTVIVPTWIEDALAELTDPSVGGVGAVFRADRDDTWLTRCQMLEWCQPPGTMVSTPDKGDVPIETLESGDKVHTVNIKNKWLRSVKTTSSPAVRDYDGLLTTTALPDGKSSRYTAEHRCLVRLGTAFHDKHLVYIMEKGDKFRVGVTKGVFSSPMPDGSVHTQYGLGWRMSGEDADRVWVIGMHDHVQDALVQESVTAYRYGIPMAVFDGGREAGLSGRYLEAMWDQVGNVQDRVANALADSGKSFSAPLYDRRGRRNTRVGWLQAIIEIPAGALEDGMLMLSLDNARAQKNAAGQISNGAWEPITVSRSPYSGPVYSIDVKDDHNYFADGILTHNCRFAEEIASARHTFVLSGTAALIRMEALQDVRARFGAYYHEDNITEDFIFSVDLLACGWELRSPDTCRSITETMPTVRDLYRQRRRWFQGALQTVTTHGLHRHTLCYWHQQTSIALGVIAFWAAWAITAVTTAAHGLYIHPWFAFVGLCFWAERVATAVRGHRLFAALLLPELAYAIVLQFTFAASVFAHFTGQAPTWHHITKERVPCS